MDVKVMTLPTSVESKPPASSPALFPTTMFPTLSQMSAQPLVHPETAKELAGAGGRDELIEIAAILAFVKLIS